MKSLHRLFYGIDGHGNIIENFDEGMTEYHHWFSVVIFCAALTSAFEFDLASEINKQIQTDALSLQITEVWTPSEWTTA